MQTQVPVSPASAKPVEIIDAVTIRFVGDSGDGMQLTGVEFTRATAIAGNDLKTFPDYPAEIRAPAGTLPGVSGFQIQFSSDQVFTSGDHPDVLVVMNPAALKTNLKDLVPGGTLILNTGAFNETNLQKAGYATNPLVDGALGSYKRFDVDITKLTELALKDSGLSSKEIGRAKNMFALGMMLWMFGRPTAPSTRYLKEKFGSKPDILAGNEKALQAGYNYGETTEMFGVSYQVRRAAIAPGTYRNVTGNEATALGHPGGHEAHRAAGLPGQLPHHAGHRHPARAVASTRTWASRPSRPRTRSRRCARRSARRSAARWPSPPPRARAWRSSRRPSAWPS